MEIIHNPVYSDLASRLRRLHLGHRPLEVPRLQNLHLARLHLDRSNQRLCLVPLRWDHLSLLLDRPLYLGLIRWQLNNQPPHLVRVHSGPLSLLINLQQVDLELALVVVVEYPRINNNKHLVYLGPLITLLLDLVNPLCQLPLLGQQVFP